MTVSNTNFENSYTTDGITTVYAFNYAATETAQIQVYLNGILQNSGFIVALSLVGVGGTVTFMTPPTTGQTLLLYRSSDLLQLDSLTDNEQLPPATIEAMIDKLTIICQQLSALFNQTPTASNSSGITNNVNSFPGGTANGGYLAGLNAAGTMWELLNPVSVFEGFVSPFLVTSSGTPANGNLAQFTGPTGITNGNLSGDISTSGSLVATLPNVNANVGTFQGIAVNAKGQVTGASNQGYISGNQNITLSGPVTGSGTTTITTSIANSGVTAGSYTSTNITVGADGRVTAASNGGGGAAANLVTTANPTGAQAGTVGQFCYDKTNAVNYICTTTGSSSTAVWTRLTESVGTIKWWWSTAAPPTGYHVCDGTNGTPNMIGMFPQGSNLTGSSTAGNSSGYDTGGSVVNQTTVGTTSNTNTVNSSFFGTSGPNSTIDSGTVGGNAAAGSGHTHSITGSQNLTYSTQPAAVAAPWIMRIT